MCNEWKTGLAALLLASLALMALPSCENRQAQLLRAVEAAKADLEKAREANLFPVKEILGAAGAYGSYISANPADTHRLPEFYHQAILLYKDAGRYDRSLGLIDSFMMAFPSHEITPQILFYKGFFIYEEGLKDYGLAREAYREFLHRFPGHHLADDVLLSMEHLGKSPEAVLKELRARQERTNMVGDQAAD